MKRVGVVQMTSTCDVESNLAFIVEHIQHAADAGCVLVAFPENALFLGATPPQCVSWPLHADDRVRRIVVTARKHGIDVAVGALTAPEPCNSADSTHCTCAACTNRVHNSLLYLCGTGKVDGDEGVEGARVFAYHKIHLFDHAESSLCESERTAAGTTCMMVDRGNAPLGACVGLSICYDVRFPRLWQAIGTAPILLCPAAFTMTTGEAHWKALLRARAIECQAYVLAPAQEGFHTATRQSYGHSIVVSPWGEVLAEACEGGPQLLVATLDMDLVREVRERMPLRQHERHFTTTTVKAQE